MQTRSLSVLSLVLVLSAGSFALADDWPQWRGPNRNAISQETGLLSEWPAEGPAVLWDVETVGVGYSSLAVQGDYVLTQGDLDGIEHVIALSAKDGKILWAVQPGPVAAALEEIVQTRFSKFDTNGDGKLDEVEAMQALGWNYNNLAPVKPGDPAAIAKARAAALIKALDKDGDGKLSYDEVPGAMQQQFARIDQEDKQADSIALAEARAKALLAAADADGDGKVSQQEARGTYFQRIFNQVDSKPAGSDKGDGLLTLDEIKTYLFAKEPGRDGLLTAAELEDFYLRNYPGRDGVLAEADIRRHYGGYRNGMGDGPRGTPTIDGDRVYAEGGNGDLTCLDLKTGKTLWHVNLASDLGGGRPGWGYCESPLIVGEQVIVTPGGKNGTLAGLNKNTGEVLWRSADLHESAHYSSPQVAEIGGVKQIVQFARENVFGVTLDGAAVLWKYGGANNGTANITTPIVDGDHVLASSAYGTGTGMVRVTTENSTTQKAEEVYFQKKLANHHGGLVKLGDHIYGFGAGLMCMDFASGEIVWSARSVGKGSLVYADGMLYCLGEGHELALVEATPEEYRERGRIKIEKLGRPAWAHPVVANGILYIRNQHQLTAYDVRAK